MAAIFLDRSQRQTVYEEEWLPELDFILSGAETRPITRLLVGVAYAGDLLIRGSYRVAYRRLDRGQVPERAESAAPPTPENVSTFLADDAQRLWRTGSVQADLLKVTLSADDHVTRSELARWVVEAKQWTGTRLTISDDSNCRTNINRAVLPKWLMGDTEAG
jgi:hypothetical protein